MTRGSYQKLLITATAAFAAVECVLGVLIQTLAGRSVVWCSYAAVLLAFFFLFLFFERTPRYFLTQTALLATVCADWFLVVDGAQKQLVGMLFFSVTQLCYAARLALDEEKRARVRHLCLRAGVSGVALLLTALVLGKNTDALALVSLFYYANLLLNIVFAFLHRERPPLLAIGLVLFALCDLFVGMSVIESYLPLAEGSFLYALAHPGFNAAWLFYVPSQTLLALSLMPKAPERVR